MKMNRLFGILTILLKQGRSTAPELAARFEVSRRTINRDIETLCQAGIPLVTTQGCGGGISIAEGYRIDTTLFSTEELETLLAGLKGVLSISEPPDFRPLLEKLSGSPAEDILLIDLANFDGRNLALKITTIKQAIRNRQLLTFRYYYPKGECLRTIEPYRLLFKWSAWYVLGYCISRQGFRLFKLNRLWEPETGSTFVARQIHLQELMPDRYFEEPAFHLKALFENQAKYRLIEEYGPNCFTETTDGRLLLERGFVNYENMLEWVLSFGGQAEVLAPESLRSALFQQAQALLKKYCET